MQPHSSGQWWCLDFWKENTEGISGCRKNHKRCPLRKHFIVFSVPPHQFCKPCAAKAKRLNDSFPSCSRCRAPQPAKPVHRRAPPPTAGDQVRATACRRACGNNTWKRKRRAVRLLLIYTRGISATSFWTRQEPEKITLKLWSGHCLWVCGTPGTSVSSPGLPSST